jgi:biopolymer transport protein TolR
MHLHRPGAKTADLNLVPYIDLLTCMVAFLLITAVWTQLARLQVRQRGAGPGGDTGIIELPPLKLLVFDDGFNLVVDQHPHPIPRRQGSHDFAALAAVLREAKLAHPDLEDLPVFSDDRVPFEILVGAMDTALSAGFPALSLVDGATTSL